MFVPGTAATSNNRSLNRTRQRKSESSKLRTLEPAVLYQPVLCTRLPRSFTRASPLWQLHKICESHSLVLKRAYVQSFQNHTLKNFGFQCCEWDVNASMQDRSQIKPGNETSCRWNYLVLKAMLTVQIVWMTLYKASGWPELWCKMCPVSICS